MRRTAEDGRLSLTSLVEKTVGVDPGGKLPSNHAFLYARLVSTSLCQCGYLVRSAGIETSNSQEIV